MSTKKEQLGIAMTALLLGSLLCIVWRSDALRMFIWLDVMGINGIVGPLRELAGSFPAWLPSWILFSLPNALWFFSGLLVLGCIWGAKSSANKLVWFCILWVIAVGIEICQAWEVIPGRFDWQDIVAMIMAGSFAHTLLLAQGGKGGPEG